MAGAGFDEPGGGFPFGEAEPAAGSEGADFREWRRRQEGHLIIADDRPILVMAFGSKYTGANPAKYKIEGKYDIPVGYKAIIKWDEDEIVFMTRQGTFGPEFQIVYLPKSPVPEDFTIFDWNANVAEIWDQLLTVAEECNDGERDTKMFNLGPWRTFGVVRDEVQIALKQGVDQKTVVSGILYCSDGQQPNLEEHMLYLGFEVESDETLVWICQAFKDEPKPPHYFQYVKDGMVYWLDSRNQETTWKHPHYDKYRKMLHVARTQKPLPNWKSIMAFRIEFLLSSLFTWECEATGEYPPVETVDNVKEMARIMNVKLHEEPYLVHVLKRALRHYAQVVKEKRKVADVQDFRNLMIRYQELVNQFEQAKEEEMRHSAEAQHCIQCRQTKAVLFCNQCRDFLCQGCFDALHARGRRQNHKRTWVELGLCAECSEVAAMFHCVQCSELYCRDCFQEWHIRGGRRNHIPIILRNFAAVADKVEEATPLMGSGIGVELAKAKSPWFAFMDEDNVRLYYNILTGESRRDMPLAAINEPIAETCGGGFSGGWAGSWGANMFADPLDDTTGRNHSNQH